jgi:tRNA-specific 2-thiouridylase
MAGSIKTLIAMSGGVDSSVAASLMLEQGHDCVGITFRFRRDESEDSLGINDAKAVALGLGIPHRVLDLTEEFSRQVIRRFIETYEQGATPNPCVICNRCLQFNLQMLRAHQLDFDFFASGHYAVVEQDAISGRYLLRKALDEKKDQSYVLYGLGQQQLSCVRFPLGLLSKQQVRKIAEDRHVANHAKAESQDICFVSNGEYGDFIEAYTGKSFPPGDIVDTGGKPLGRHRGIIRYTIGQRRGLGVASGSPLYVAAKSVADNTVTLGPDSSLYSKTLTARDINLIACARLDKALRVTVKTRYLQTAQSALAEQTSEDELHIEFDSPQRAITPGQSAVMYDGDIVVGGGIIG